MRKFILLNTVLFLSTATFAQKQNVQNAIISLKEKDYKQATKEINEAVDNPTTKEDPKAWFVRGNIYLAMQEVEEYKASSPYREASKSYREVAKLKPTYEKDAVNGGLAYTAQLYYIDAVDAYNNKKYSESVNLAKYTIDIRNIEDGKRFAANKNFDTIAANALMIGAYAAYYNNDYDKALPMLVSLTGNPIAKDANAYLYLADIYSKQNKAKEQLAIIEEGKKQFPKNEYIRNAELNYYKQTEQEDVFMSKLQAAAESEPNNPVLQANLALGYMSLAFPKDANNKELPSPKNYDELVNKAEVAFDKAVKGDSKNLDYNYNAGVLFYNRASNLQNRMNDITGNTDAENKKYDALKAERDQMFVKAIPLFDNIVQLLSPKASSLNEDEMFFYRNALTVLKEIYAKQDKMDKSNEMKAKLEATR